MERLLHIQCFSALPAALRQHPVLFAVLRQYAATEHGTLGFNRTAGVASAIGATSSCSSCSVSAIGVVSMVMRCSPEGKPPLFVHAQQRYKRKHTAIAAVRRPAAMVLNEF
jgi:hypothetical protein